MMQTVLTLGTFDLLHEGHFELLDACREMADGGFVIVALNRDDFVGRYKDRRPVQSYEDRRAAMWPHVDAVVCNVGDEDSGVAISVVDPDIIAVGDDWQSKDYLGQLGVTQEWLDERGILVVYVPRTTGISTSKLRGL